MTSNLALGVGVDELLQHAYRLGGGDPWPGFLIVQELTKNLDDVRDVGAIVRWRLREKAR